MLYFHDIITVFYNLNFPCQIIKVPNKYKKAKWITKGVSKSCNTKRILRYQYDVVESERNKQQYRLYSKTLRKSLNVAQKLHNDNLIKSAKKKQKHHGKLRQKNLKILIVISLELNNARTIWISSTEVYFFGSFQNTENVYKGIPTTSVFFDMTRAFEFVSRDLLFEK